MSTTLEKPSVDAPTSPTDCPYLFSADDFYRIIALGIFPDHARVGLWDGRIHEEMSKHYPDSWASLNAALMPVLPPGADKVPLPDLLIEVADSSLKINTGARLEGYARAGIPVYWVVNLKEGVVQVHESPVPSEGRYGSILGHGPGSSIAFKLDGNVVALIPASDIL